MYEMSVHQHVHLDQGIVTHTSEYIRGIIKSLTIIIGSY